MPRLTQRPRARADVLEIWVHIAQDSVTATDRWVSQLDEKLQLLLEHPQLGRARSEIQHGLRAFPFGDYLIFYAAVVGGIEIIRVLHGARDIRKLLTT